MFPITYRHQFNYAVQGDERWIAGMLRARIAASLKKKGALKVAVDGQHVQFEGRFSSPRFSRFPLHDISKGDIAVACSNNQLSLMLELNFAGFIIFAFVSLLFVLFMLGGVAGMAGTSDVFTASTLLAFSTIGLMICLGRVVVNCLEFSKLMQDQTGGFFKSVVELGIKGQQITSR